MVIPDRQLFHCRGFKPVPNLWLAFNVTRRLAAGQPIPIVLRPTPTERSLMRDFTRLFSDDDPSQSQNRDRIFHAAMALLHVVLSRPEIDWQQSVPAAVVQTIQYIEEHYASPILIPRLARMANLCTEALARSFKKHQGETIGRFIVKVRVREAAHLLTHTDVRIEEIAEVGRARRARSRSATSTAAKTSTPGSIRPAGTSPASTTAKLDGRWRRQARPRPSSKSNSGRRSARRRSFRPSRSSRPSRASSTPSSARTPPASCVSRSRARPARAFTVQPSEYRTDKGEFMKPRWGARSCSATRSKAAGPKRISGSSTTTASRQSRLTGAVPAGQKNPKSCRSSIAWNSCMCAADLPEVGQFKTSSPLYNDTHRLIDWAMRSNMTYVLTDCPHREKLGWLECAHLLVPTFSYRYDCRDWFAKIARDIRDAQEPCGRIPTVAPAYPHFGGGFQWTVEWARPACCCRGSTTSGTATRASSATTTIACGGSSTTWPPSRRTASPRRASATGTTTDTASRPARAASRPSN